MSATKELASMLDELMGRHRNALPSERPKETTWDDPEVCKYFLVSFCPHEMFTNTKADLGHCDKIHDERLKEQYQKSSRFQKAGLEEDFLAFLQKLHSDMQRKIKKNKQRLELTQPGGQISDMNKERLEDKIRVLSEKIVALQAQAEHLGAQGKVDEAQGVIKMADDLTDERDHCKRAMDTPLAELKLMEVCEICGCFLIVGDSQHRIDEHLTGKQHMGYAKIKDTIDSMIAEREQRRKEKDAEEKQKRREVEKKRHHSRSRSRDRSHKHTRKSRSQSGSKTKRRSRSRHRSSSRANEKTSHGHSHSRSAHAPSFSRSVSRSHNEHHHGSKRPRGEDDTRHRKRDDNDLARKGKDRERSGSSKKDRSESHSKESRPSVDSVRRLSSSDLTSSSSQPQNGTGGPSRKFVQVNGSDSERLEEQTGNASEPSFSQADQANSSGTSQPTGEMKTDSPVTTGQCSILAW